jgi:hypothetical protein
MTARTYDKAATALLFVDPYNDFLSQGGKVWPRVKNIALEVGLLDNLRAHPQRDAPRRYENFHRAPSSLGARRL